MADNHTVTEVKDSSGNPCYAECANRDLLGRKIDTTYLPLSGGTLTGDLVVGNTTISASAGYIKCPEYTSDGNCSMKVSNSNELTINTTDHHIWFNYADRLNSGVEPTDYYFGTYGNSETQTLANVHAKKFTGDLSGTAANATNDDAGNRISTTYLSKTDASSTYVAKSDASSTYLSKADASSTYVAKSDASSTYLSKTDASSTYLAKSSLNTINGASMQTGSDISISGTMTSGSIAINTTTNSDFCKFAYNHPNAIWSYAVTTGTTSGTIYKYPALVYASNGWKKFVMVFNYKARVFYFNPDTKAYTEITSGTLNYSIAS